MFSTHHKTNFKFSVTFILSSANAFNLDKSKIFSFGNGLIGPELSELFALEIAKIAESDFVYTLASTNVDQLVPNMVTIYMTMSSWMNSIMGQI